MGRCLHWEGEAHPTREWAMEVIAAGRNWLTSAADKGAYNVLCMSVRATPTCRAARLCRWGGGVSKPYIAMSH
jgi:hypothetical protein